MVIAIAVRKDNFKCFFALFFIKILVNRESGFFFDKFSLCGKNQIAKTLLFILPAVSGKFIFL
jgi:hypothetical protein